MLRPLLLNQSVSLVFEDASALPPLFTDEGKVSQILRNLISNALKFTERGEVRVSAPRRTRTARPIAFTVADTGIGIAPPGSAADLRGVHAARAPAAGAGARHGPRPAAVAPPRRTARRHADGDQRAGHRLDLHAAPAGRTTTPGAACDAAAFDWEPDPASCRCWSSRTRRTRSIFYEKVLRSSGVPDLSRLHAARSGDRAARDAAGGGDPRLVLGRRGRRGASWCACGATSAPTSVPIVVVSALARARQGDRAWRRRLPVEASRPARAARHADVAAGAHRPATARALDRR